LKRDLAELRHACALGEHRAEAALGACHYKGLLVGGQPLALAAPAEMLHPGGGHLLFSSFALPLPFSALNRSRPHKSCSRHASSSRMTSPARQLRQSASRSIGNKLTAEIALWGS